VQKEVFACVSKFVVRGGGEEKADSSDSKSVVVFIFSCSTRRNLRLSVSEMTSSHP
jgi:hypothetical protein